MSLEITHFLLRIFIWNEHIAYDKEGSRVTSAFFFIPLSTSTRKIKGRNTCSQFVFFIKYIISVLHITLYLRTVLRLSCAWELRMKRFLYGHWLGKWKCQWNLECIQTNLSSYFFFTFLNKKSLKKWLRSETK